MASKGTLNIDDLIDIVREGGAIKTGISFFSDRGDLLLDKDVLVTRISTLLHIKRQGHAEIPFDGVKEGGIWDKNGEKLQIGTAKEEGSQVSDDQLGLPPPPLTTLERKLQEIKETRQELEIIQNRARTSILNAVHQIIQNNGEFEADKVIDVVNGTVDFLKKNKATLYLVREIFSHDNYIYNHSVNVCTLGAAVLHRFNLQISSMINGLLINNFDMPSPEEPAGNFLFYQKEELQEISLGFFLHDIGKVLLPVELLNKESPYTPEEMDLFKSHSDDLGARILDKNNINSALIRNSVFYHHSPLFVGEENSYPEEKPPEEIPLYAKICKLVDRFDTMTSKRPDHQAMNPISAVTEIVRQNTNRNRCLQILLATFVKVIGVYPPGSVVFLQNGQLAYIVETEGPIVLPFTDIYQKPISPLPDPIDLSSPEFRHTEYQIDRRKPPLDPLAYYSLLPAVLR